MIPNSSTDTIGIAFATVGPWKIPATTTADDVAIPLKILRRCWSDTDNCDDRDDCRQDCCFGRDDDSNGDKKDKETTTLGAHMIATTTAINENIHNVEKSDLIC
jgi:hypothetical protein